MNLGSDHLLGSLFVLLIIFGFGYPGIMIICGLYEYCLEKSVNNALIIGIARVGSICVGLLGAKIAYSYARAKLNEISVEFPYVVNINTNGFRVTGIAIPNGQLVLDINTGVETLEDDFAQHFGFEGIFTVSENGENLHETVTLSFAGEMPKTLTSHNRSLRPAVAKMHHKLKLPEVISPDCRFVTISADGDLVSTFFTGPSSFAIRQSHISSKVAVPVKQYNGLEPLDLSGIEIRYIFQFAGLFLLCSSPLAISTAERVLLRNFRFLV